MSIPDAEQLLWEYLRDQDAVTSLVPATRIVSSAPDDTAAPFVILRRVSGLPLFSRPLVAEQPRIQVDVYGGPKSYAYQISEAIRQACSVMTGAHPRGVVGRVDFGAMIYVPDSALASEGGGPRPRYIFDVRPIVKAPASPPA